MFKRLICGVPTAATTGSSLSLKRQRFGNVQTLLVAGGLALLTPALLLPVLSGCSENSVEPPAANRVSALKATSAPQLIRMPLSRTVVESDNDNLAAVDDFEAIEISPDNFVALAADDATLTDLTEDADELTGPFGCPRMSAETRVAAAPQLTPSLARSSETALPLPVELSDLAPELPEVLPEALVETASSAVKTTLPIAESTELDLPDFDDEPGPVAKPKVNPGAIRLIALLEADDVKQLVVRARLELAAGDVLLAHRFAEAAAEVPIPLELFRQRPIAVLDEIDFTNQIRSTAQATELAQQTSEPPSAEPATVSESAVVAEEPSPLAEEPSIAQAPAEKAAEKAAEPTAPVAKPKGPSPTERIKKTPRAFQAIAQASLSVQPRLMEKEGQPQRLPESEARKQMAQLPTLEHTIGTGRNWGSAVYSWDAPSFYHSPLYFEDLQLERYGNEIAFVQPLMSGVHFLKDVATLPYQMGIEGNGPCAEIYDLGHDRPGDCVRYSWQRLPWSTTGALTQAGAALGLIYIIP